jgi:hypothetical protein
VDRGSFHLEVHIPPCRGACNAGEGTRAVYAEVNTQQVILLDDAKKAFLHILRDTPQLVSQLEQTPSGESYIPQILTACNHRLSSRWDDPAFSWATWGHNKHVALQKATGRFGGKETKLWVQIGGQHHPGKLTSMPWIATTRHTSLGSCILANIFNHLIDSTYYYHGGKCTGVWELFSKR